jgi:hypothetical protein
MKKADEQFSVPYERWRRNMHCASLPLSARKLRPTPLVVILSLSLMAGCSMIFTKPLPPVTVPQIIQMSNAKVPPGEIIQKMRDSGTVYRLQASQLAQLKEQGVPDAVLDYMQQTYLDAARQDQSREDFNSSAMAGDGFLYGGPWW